MNKIAIILGTSNQQGNTVQLTNVIQQQLLDTQQAEVKVFNLYDFQMSFFDYQHLNRDDDFLPLVKEMMSFDTWVFASPVYWYSMSAQLKVFVDRLSDLLTIEKDLGRQLRGKNAAFYATSASSELPQCFIDVFTKAFNYLGMNFLAHVHCDSSEGFDAAVHQAAINDFVGQISP